MIITEYWDDGRDPVRLPSVTALTADLASDDHVAACAAIRDLRRLLDLIEMSRLALLAAEPGMTAERMSRITGRTKPWLARQGYSPSSPSLSSPRKPPSPRVSEGPSGS